MRLALEMRGIVLFLIHNAAAERPPAPPARSDNNNNEPLSEGYHSLFLKRAFPFNRYLDDALFKGGGAYPPDEDRQASEHRDSLFSSEEAEASAHLSPVLFIPGLTMSKIAANLRSARGESQRQHFYCAKNYENYTLWIDRQELLPLENHCWCGNVEIEWEVVEPTSREDGYPVVKEKDVGINAYLPGVADYELNSTDEADGYVFDAYKFIHGNMTQRLGYERAQWGNWYFDFRRGPNEFAVDGTFERLKQQVELYYGQSNGTRVVFISISMGGPVIHAFLHWIEVHRFASVEEGRSWKEKFIGRWVSLSGVFGGTSMITSTTLKPTFADTYQLYKKLWWVDWDEVRDAVTSWAGCHLMQPQVLGKDEPVLTVVDNKTDPKKVLRTYTVSQLPDAFTDAGLKSEIKYVLGAQQRWWFANLHSPNVDTDCVHGSGLTVPKTFVFEADLKQMPNVLVNDTTGDLVVNGDSLKLCREWKGANGGKAMVEKDFPGFRHGMELSSKEGVDYVLGILKQVALGNRDRAVVALRNRDGAIVGRERVGEEADGESSVGGFEEEVVEV